MFKSRHARFVSVGARGRAAFLALTCATFFTSAAVRAPLSASSAAKATTRAAQEAERLDIRMRSFAPPASGRVTVEASSAGGSGRVTVLSLPDPQTVSPGARSYVVWAVSEGRIARLGELRRDERGNGGLAFERPDGFDRYSVVVTAESSPDAERPGSPVLSTRANEATALYPRPAEERTPTDPAVTPTSPTTQPTTTQPSTTQPTTAQPSSTQPPLPALPVSRARAPRAGDFYTEVEDAIATSGGGRVIELEGARVTPSARGTARATTHAGSAYVRANFRGVPLPSNVGAAVYVLWAIVPDGRIIYMGSLPSNEDLNAAEIYVRTAGFGDDTFELFVTAERARPAPAPSDTKVLTPKHTSTNVR